MEDAALTLEEGCIVGNKWKITEKIASGGFGSIFQAQNIRTQELVALKTEKKTVKDYLKIESDVYKLIDGKCKTSYVKEGEELSCRVLVMEVLGSSLSDLFYQMNKQFSLKTVLLIGIQMVERLADLHNVGIVHRDIKPGNFVMGRGDKSHTVYLLDFGLSHSYMYPPLAKPLAHECSDPKTNSHIPYQENVAFRGTHRYASINAHLRIEQSRRDDLEALGYVLIYFLKGLPWANLQVERKDRRKVIGEAKQKTSIDSLTEGIPRTNLSLRAACNSVAQFKEYLLIVRKLEFDEDPEYDALTKLFKDCLQKEKMKIDNNYDWTGKTKISSQEPKVPVVDDAPPKKRRAVNPEQTKKRKSEDVDYVDTKPSAKKKPKRSLSNAVAEISDELLHS